MQDRIIEYFMELTKIPHCSKNSNRLLEFLKEFAISRGYSVEIDSKKNILAKKGKPKLALQAHYDMVCIGKAPNIKPYIKDGWIEAKESSLGADNGIAIAMMMLLMDMDRELEFIFTSDEEIGLIGASALEFKLNSRNILNLDFEDEAEVCIGCAGGADLIAFRRVEMIKPLKYNYRLRVSGLKGGHSGIDIDKGIDNAIKVLANYLQDKNLHISSFMGGERINSIPTNAMAIVSSMEILKSSSMVEVEAIDESIRVYESRDFINLLNESKHGVISFNGELNIPDISINLAKVDFKNGNINIASSARAMSKDGLESISKESMEIFQKYKFDIKITDKYPSWQPEINSFTKEVYRSMESVFGEAKYRAIHAGLECGIILQRYPDIKVASIGPTIVYPHSTREKVKIDSIKKTFEVILNLI